MYAVYQKRAQLHTPALTKEEELLLKKILHKLPEGVKKRFDYLKSIFDEEKLSGSEYDEYTGLLELMEGHDAECLSNIHQLALLRGIPPQKLMEQLQITPLYSA